MVPPVRIAGAFAVTLSLAGWLFGASPAPPPSASTSTAHLAAWRDEDAIQLVRVHVRGLGLNPRLLVPIVGSRYDPGLIVPVEERVQEGLEWAPDAWLVWTAVGSWWAWDDARPAAAD